MTKVQIVKHCRVDGKPVQPGDVVETSPHRAKALTDNGYAKAAEKKAAKAEEKGSAADAAANPEETV